MENRRKEKGGGREMKGVLGKKNATVKKKEKGKETLGANY